MRICVLVAITLFARVGSGQAGMTPLSCDAIVPPSDSGSGQFGAVAPGRGERLAWFDGQPGQFALRDGSGKIRLVGRQGAGPGEFDRPGFMNWIGDTLWVSDYRLHRVQFFSDTGRLIRVATAMLPGNWGAGRDGRLVGFGPVPPRISHPVNVLSHLPGSARLDTLRTFPVVSVDRMELPLRDESVYVPQPLAAQTVIGSNAEFNRFCAAVPEANSLRLMCVDGRGRAAMNKVVSLPPRALSDAVYDSTIAFYLRTPGRTDAMMRSRVARPRHLPLALGMMVDQLGGVWLQRSHRYEATGLWTRLRPDGTILSDLVLPKRLRLLRLSGDSFWAATADADGLETLHKCRIGG